MSKDNIEFAAELRKQAQDLLDRADRLEKEPLCDHHWNASDRCYECYCTGCGKHLREAHFSSSIPFKADAYCYECRKTPEEKAEEKRVQEENKRAQEIESLRRLKEKYPEV